MNVESYLALVGRKIQEAADRGDKEEAIRLMSVLIDVLKEKMNELQG